MLIDISGPPSEPITLTEAKAFLRVDHDDEDMLIQTLIRASRERLESHLNIAMIQRSMQVTANQGQGGTVNLPRWPVQSVETVLLDGKELDASVDLNCRPVRVDVFGPGRIEIEFTAGYGLSPDDVPAPLRQAMLLLVSRGFEHREGEPDSLPLMVDALTMPYRVVGL